MKDIFYKFGFTNPLDGWISPLVVLSLITMFVVVTGSMLLQWRRRVCKFNTTKNIIKHTPLRFITYCVLYLLSGILQQSFLVLVYNIFEWFCPSCYWNKIFAAGIFALFHFPNFLLMFAVMGMGIVFLSHFELYHNIYIIGLLHGLIANVMKFSLPEELSTSFTVWFKYIAFYRKDHRRKKALSKLSKFLKDKGKLNMIYSIKPDIGEQIHTGLAYFTDTAKHNNKPDVVINVLGKDNGREIRYDKPLLYRIANVPEYWIVDPYNKSVEVFTLTTNGYDLYCFAFGNHQVKSKMVNDFDKTAEEIFVRFELFNINPAM